MSVFDDLEEGSVPEPDEALQVITEIIQGGRPGFVIYFDAGQTNGVAEHGDHMDETSGLAMVLRMHPMMVLGLLNIVQHTLVADTSRSSGKRIFPDKD